jgi:pilus assembly protein CpaB
MRLKPLIMIILAVVFGGSAILVGNSWLQRQAERHRPVAAAPSEVPRATIVVAASPLRYGDEVGRARLREIPWPGDALPAGAFATLDEATRGGPRLALAAIERNEPVLRGKLTGEGQRATLSALLSDSMGAVTIAVDEVIGLAGFVLPGDRVDVLLTQDAAEGGGGLHNDRILHNVRVVAVGQTADEKTDKPTVVRAVTVEVDTRGAQKVALASRLGRLSLVLRKAGETAPRSARRLTAGEVAEGSAAEGDGASVHVTRGATRTTYAVPRLGAEAVPDAAFATGNIARRPGAPAARTEAVAEPPKGDR